MKLKILNEEIELVKKEEEEKKKSIQPIVSDSDPYMLYTYGKLGL